MSPSTHSTSAPRQGLGTWLARRAGLGHARRSRKFAEAIVYFTRAIQYSEEDASRSDAAHPSSPLLRGTWRWRGRWA